MEICPCALERQTIIVSICNVACCVCVQTPRRSKIYCTLLAAIGTVSGVFGYYPHPGGQI